MAQQVCHLTGCQGFYRAVLLLYPVHQVGGECVPERMQAFFLNPRRSQDTVVTLAEIHRPGVVAMLIRHQERVLPKICLCSQVLDHGNGCVVQWY